MLQNWRMLPTAFRIAQTGRPGPVVIDITKNVTATKTEYTYKKPEPILPDASVINEIDVEKAVTMIAHSKRPFVFVGGGVTLANASEELRRFVKKIDAPVADSLMGKGAFDGTSDAYVGMLGMHGTKAANYGLNQSDLIIVVGSRFSDRVIGNPKTFGNKAQILQIDVDASEINKNIVVTHCIAGDAKLVLRKLSAQLNQMEHNEWMQYINELKTRYPLTYPKDRLTGPQIVETIYEMTHGDAVICTEVVSIRCGQLSSINMMHRENLFHRAALGLWGMVSAQVLALRWPVRKKRSSILPVTVVSE